MAIVLLKMFAILTREEMKKFWKSFVYSIIRLKLKKKKNRKYNYFINANKNFIERKYVFKTVKNDIGQHQQFD